MNWFKESQAGDAGAILFSMLMDAGKNPAKPLSIASRFAGMLPGQINQAIQVAYSKIMQNSNGFLNESQKKLLAEAREMVDGVPQMQNQNDPMELPQENVGMGDLPQEAPIQPQG
jgi:Skp family chaperone for outer membrane proteins